MIRDEIRDRVYRRGLPKAAMHISPRWGLQIGACVLYTFRPAGAWVFIHQISISGILQMTAVIITIGSILAIVGVGVAIWSIVTTRKKYYEDYIRRKRRVDD